MKKDDLKVVEKLSRELFDLIGSQAKISVEADEKNEAVLVNLNAPEEAGILIGRHGETLNSIQTILSLMARQRIGEWLRIIVNVGDWREKQESRLRDLAEQAAFRAKETGQPQPIYNLNSSQRRIIHLALAGDPQVETISEGEGEERYLIVKPVNGKKVKDSKAG